MIASKQLFQTGLAAMVIVLGLVPASQAREISCAQAIAAAERKLNTVLDQRAKAGPTARETPFATLGRQPTPGTIAAAEDRLDGWTGGAEAASALTRARQAEARGRTRDCRAEVARVRKALLAPAQ